MDLEEKLKRYLNINDNWKSCIKIYDHSVKIEYDGSLNYGMLDKLSELFETKNINFGTETRHAGGCESCDFTYNVVVLDIKNARFNKLEALEIEERTPEEEEFDDEW